MTDTVSGVPRGFHLFSLVVVFFAILLIWKGAATTTEEAGMAFSDWPLSLGSVNPPGWLSYSAPFLEHSHRLLGTLVGTLTLLLFGWIFLSRGGRWWELVVLVAVLATVFGLFIAAGAERSDPDRKRLLMTVAVLSSLVPVSWLVASWFLRRNWDFPVRLTGLALLMVTAQAILGGMRVSEISNTFAVIHGCLAQAFFCVLILIILVSSKKWETFRFSRLPASVGGFLGAFLTLLVSIQLLLGASMRHFHRTGLADDGVLRTEGRWIPAFDEPIIAVLFLHKLTAVLVALALTGSLFMTWRWRGARRHLLLIGGVVLVQIMLGVGVIHTGKSFWITNFHVLSGLAILALSFTFLVRGVRSPGRVEAPTG